jgi:hypothetical protein
MIFGTRSGRDPGWPVLFRGRVQLRGAPVPGALLARADRRHNWLALVLARATLGPWGAPGGGGVPHTAGHLRAHRPRFPPPHLPRFRRTWPALWWAEAVAVWPGTDNHLRYALLSGVAIAAVGMAGELAWVTLSGRGDLHLNDSRMLLVVPAAAVAAAVLGGALSRPVWALRTVPGLGRRISRAGPGRHRALPAAAQRGLGQRRHTRGLAGHHGGPASAW